jgi:hypothetical protein
MLIINKECSHYESEGLLNGGLTTSLRRHELNLMRAVTGSKEDWVLCWSISKV